MATNRKIPDKLVALTFDDGCKSDIKYVAPLLKKYGFGATFFVFEGFNYYKGQREKNYLTWQEVKKIHDMGFEIGNHTRTHPYMPALSKKQIREEIEYAKRYLSCMKIRFQDSLHYSIDIPEPLLCVKVPKLISQPIIENTMKYGIDTEPPWEVAISGTVSDAPRCNVGQQGCL